MRNLTPVIVAGAVTVAVAERSTVELPVTEELADGVVRATERPEVTTVTLTAAEVVTAELRSVTRAVREKGPAVVGVQLTVDATPEAGALTVPTSVVPTKKSTLATVVPTLAAVAVRGIGVTIGRVKIVPAVGAVRVTVGAVTMTFTIADVTAVPLESVTRAVSAVMPAAVGVQLT